MNRLADFFSPATTAVLRRAQQYADTRQEALGTAHIVKALFEVDRTVAYDVLRSTAKQTISLVKHPLKSDADQIPALLEKAAHYAQNYHFSHIEPEHLLLVILDYQRLAGHKLLVQSGIKIKETGQKLAEWMFGVSLLNTADAGLQTLAANSDTATAGKTESKQNLLLQVTTDITKLAKEHQLGTIVAREEEIANVIRTLLRHKKNNPLLIGEPGVGKTAVVHGLASRIAAGQVPTALQHTRILELSVASLVAGTVYRGQFEERVRRLLEAIKEESNIILFIDEIHTITGAGSTEGALDLANILKPLLAQGELALIGATTFEEYTKHLSHDRALARRFQNHFITEPDTAKTIAMVKAAVPHLQRHHQVTIPMASVKLAVELADRFLPDRPFPDKAIDILDEAGATTHLSLPPDTTITNLKSQLRRTLQRKYNLIDAGKLNEAITLRTREQQLMKQLLVAKDVSVKQQSRQRVSTQTVVEVVSRLAQIPVAMVQIGGQVSPQTLTTALKKGLVGQDAAINSVVRALGRTLAGFKKPHQPIAAFIFIGPTGVGKTELAKLLATQVFGRPQALIKLDMSELSERHTVSQLVGSPKGYVGHDDGGTLVDKIRQNPHSVVLFDEVEKAHPDVFNLLLQILEDGVLTDTHGQTGHFRHSLIVLTSNIGTEFWGATGLGFNPPAAAGETQVNAELAEYFRPELLARFTTVIHFKPFRPTTVKKLLQRRLQATVKTLRQHGQRLTIDPTVVSWLATQYDPNKGARSVDDLVKRYVEDVLVTPVLASKQTSLTLRLTANKSRLTVL